MPARRSAPNSVERKTSWCQTRRRDDGIGDYSAPLSRVDTVRVNDDGAFEISVPDDRLSELIDAVHRVAANPGTGPGHTGRARNISIADLEVGCRKQDGTTRRNVAGIVLRAAVGVRVYVVFSLDGDTATARFGTAHTDGDNLAELRQVSFARYVTTATMAGLAARGIAAVRGTPS